MKLTRAEERRVRVIDGWCDILAKRVITKFGIEKMVEDEWIDLCTQFIELVEKDGDWHLREALEWADIWMRGYLCRHPKK